MQENINSLGLSMNPEFDQASFHKWISFPMNAPENASMASYMEVLRDFEAMYMGLPL